MKNTICMALGATIFATLSCTGPEAAVDLQAEVPGVFKHGVPQTARLKPPSWKSFRDPEVLRLVTQVRTSNKDLKAASAQAREFLALIRKAHSASAVTVDGFGNVSADLENSTRTRDFSGGLSAAFEIDLWGRLRKATEAAASRAWASTAARDNLQLSLEAQAVSTYYTIRSLDSQIQSVNEAIARLQEIGRIANREIEAGLLGAFEKSRVDSAISTLKADRATLQRDRNRFENALAVLLGTNPSLYTAAKKGLTNAPPSIATYLPSSLLERRPDIAEAKALLEANQADIGVAWGDFFPRLNLFALIGLASPSLSQFFDGSEATSVGGDILGPILDGGERRANYDAAIARRDQGLAILEGTILRAFEDTENVLSDTQVLKAEYNARRQAVANARETIKGVRRRHRDGIDGLFQLVSIELSLNVQERLLHEAHGQQFVAAADVVRALGGDWRR